MTLVDDALASPPRASRRARRPRSLAGRLLLVVAVLALVSLASSAVLTALALRPFLVDGADERLLAARVPASFRLYDQAAGQVQGSDGQEFDDVLLPAGSLAATVAPDGTVGEVLVFGTDDGDRPAWPADLATRALDEPFDVTAVDGRRAGTYRAVVAQSSIDGTRYVVAVSLDEVAEVVANLGRVALSVTTVVLVVTILLGWWLVRLGLAPLRRIEQSAAAIAAGDLSHRVPGGDPQTEVGRLSAALNRMLADIETAFAARVASEDRLRRFVADASHELRTPLVSIRGYAELFFRGARDRPDDLETSMLRIGQEAERMGILVDELLLLARFDQSRDLEADDVDLVALARDAVADLQAVEPDRSVTVEGPERLVVVGDEVRLRQVVTNLLANVRQHTPPGTPAKVRLELQGGEAVLSVADQGPGMAEADAARIFERFYRTDRARQRTRGGNGLGLAIVATLVEAHGGRVTVRSAPGAGATFEVRLPVAGTAPAVLD